MTKQKKYVTQPMFFKHYFSLWILVYWSIDVFILIDWKVWWHLYYFGGCPQELMVRWLCFLFTIRASLWLPRMVPALWMDTMCSPEQYLLWSIMGVLLLRVVWVSLFMLVHTHGRWLAFTGWFFTHDHQDTFVVGCWLHAHSPVVDQSLVAEGVVSLQVIGLAAIHLSAYSSWSGNRSNSPWLPIADVWTLYHLFSLQQLETERATFIF